VFAGSSDLEALSLPHVVLRKIVHENYHTNTEGAPVNDIAVFRVRVRTMLKYSSVSTFFCPENGGSMFFRNTGICR
jgi:hypothetical protein